MEKQEQLAIAMMNMKAEADDFLEILSIIGMMPEEQRPPAKLDQVAHDCELVKVVADHVAKRGTNFNMLLASLCTAFLKDPKYYNSLAEAIAIQFNKRTNERFPSMNDSRASEQDERRL